MIDNDCDGDIDEGCPVGDDDDDDVTEECTISVSPSSIDAGDTVDVAIIVGGLVTIDSSSVNFSCSSITVNSTTVNGDTITASVTVDDDAPDATCTVTVTIDDVSCDDTISVRAGTDLNTIESIYENMVSIPGGTFEMGCSAGDTWCEGDESAFQDESPRHTVTISSFKMSAYEVTQGQWETVMGDNPSYFSPGYDFPECLHCPVEQVSWDDVQDFIEALNSQTGKQYRLPTEAEWEYAARAGTTTMYYCGDDETCLADSAWYIDNSGEVSSAAGQKTPNAWGLYNMLGNVFEWVQDWYDEEYYTSSPGTDPQGLESGAYRVFRGGSWGSYARACRLSIRGYGSPSFNGSFLGFRLCLTE